MAPAKANMPSPHRRSRIGAASLDMIMMIIVIVALLGVATFAIIEAGNVARDEGYVQASEGFPDELRASLREGHRALDGAIAIAGVDKETFEKQMLVRTTYSEAGDSSETNVGMPALAMPSKTAGSDAAAAAKKLPEVAGSDDLKGLNGAVTAADGATASADSILKRKEIFEARSGMTLEGAIGETDKVINALITVVGAWGKLSVVVDKATLVSSKAYQSASATNFADIEAAAKAFKDSLDSAIENLGTSSSKSVEDRNNAYARANAAYDDFLLAIKEATISVSAGGSEEDEDDVSLDAVMAKINAQVAELNKIREDTLAHFARRTGTAASQNDYKGYVVDSNRENGWAWINIGQDQGVMPGMNFDVQRPSEDRTGLIKVGTIMVTKILSTGGARCRVLSEISGFFPRRGDSLVQPNFSHESYSFYSLVGDFGGEHSRFSRAELKRMLRERGFSVHDEPSNKTEVIVLGANWQDDPRIAKLISGASKTFPNHVKYTEAKLLYLLGVEGPKRAR